MFNKILIANRGEIAVRVIRTAKALGYRTVAVYSTSDKHAPHVTLADEAVCIGAGAASESYLNPQKILDAARATNSDAIHPGYGFLSENSDFASACVDAAITFVGPSASAIELMGSKRVSKVAMIKANVPCIPGYEDQDQSDSALIDAAVNIGFPLMVKASAGGGGRGMRLVNAQFALSEALKSARSEALNAFGSDDLILERALLDAKHIEIQIIADTHGNVIHLAERDCSMQRRHQKVVEEAPSLVLTPALREEMGQAAVSAAKACDYVGAGTVEFLLTSDNVFYFLEMNTRLQVEHPVTELVTNLDLVELQLRVAAGEALPLTQDQVQINGHAIEVRLYAEDPANNFMPQTGIIDLWQPALVDDVSGEKITGVRVDSGIKQGSEISPFYDPMLAKFIAYGQNREQARRRLVRLVNDSHLLGVRDNRAFLTELLTCDTFIKGAATTNFVGDKFSDNPSLTGQKIADQEWALAALLMSIDVKHNISNSFHSAAVGQRLVKLHSQELAQHWSVERTNANSYRVAHEQFSTEFELIELNDNKLRFVQENIMRTAVFSLDLTATTPSLWLASTNGNIYFNDSTLVVSKAASVGSNKVLALMDGVIIDVLVEAGQTVKCGDALAVIESMKMEHPLKAGVDGVIKTVFVSTGDQVKGRQLLIELEA